MKTRSPWIVLVLFTALFLASACASAPGGKMATADKVDTRPEGSGTTGTAGPSATAEKDTKTGASTGTGAGDGSIAPEVSITDDGFGGSSPTLSFGRRDEEAERDMPADSMAATRPEGAFKASDGVSPSTSSAKPREAPTESGLKAGFSDDNEQFNYFLGFLEEYKDVDHYPLKVQERISLTVQDAAGRPVSGAAVTVLSGAKKLSVGKTWSNGLFHLFPLEYDSSPRYAVQVSYGSQKKDIVVERDGPRDIRIQLSGLRNPPAPLPLDILFILDTTGSMGEEIERLKDNIEIIQANVTAVTPKPAVRFGLVLYKDRGDEYVTQRVPFTSDLEAFMADLEQVDADGGGDTPEDLQTALRDAMQKMDWNADGIRLAFIITDAEAHLDYGQTYTYAQAARDAKAKAIKLYTVGTGGLGIEGEYLLRQISQYTAARYIFLTYGERGESEGGAMASVSHHTGSNFQTDKLEAIIIRFAREELAHQSDVPLVEDEPYFDAQKVPDESREKTLEKLFGDALGNLVDYSTFKLGKDAKAAILPILLGTTDETPALKSQAEYFSEQLLLAAFVSRPFVVVDRSNLQALLKEQSLQLSGIVDEATASKVGKLLGAEYLVSGRLFQREDRWEIFLQLLRVETGEVLSVTKAKLSKELGL